MDWLKLERIVIFEFTALINIFSVKNSITVKQSTLNLHFLLSSI